MSLVAVGRIPLGLVIKSLADLVHQNYVLPILHVETGGTDERKNRALSLPHDVIILRREGTLGSNGRAVLQSLVDETPK